MTDLEKYLAELPELSDKELNREARSAGALLSRAKKSGSTRSAENLQVMRDAIRAEKAIRKGHKNPRKTLYIKPTKAAIAAAKKGLEARKKAPKSKKGGLDTQQAKAEGVGSGVARARDIIAGKRVNAYQVKAFFDRHRQNYLDAKLRGLRPEESKAIQAWLIWGGEPLRKQAEQAVEKDKKMAKNPKEYTVKIFRGKHAGKTKTYKTLKSALRACDRFDLEYGAICCNLVRSSEEKENPKLTREEMKKLQARAAQERLAEAMGYENIYEWEEDKKKHGKKKKEKNPPRKKKKKKKKEMSTAGRAAVGAGIGALALGPIGAIGLGYGAAKYKPKKVKGNPKVTKRQALRELLEAGEIPLYPEWVLTTEALVKEGLAERKKDNYKITAAGRLELQKKNPKATEYQLEVGGSFYSLETGRQPVKRRLTIMATSQDAARKKAVSRMSDEAHRIGYEYDGTKRDVKVIKKNPRIRSAKKNPHKKTARRSGPPRAGVGFTFIGDFAGEDVFFYEYKKAHEYELVIYPLEVALQEGLQHSWWSPNKLPPPWFGDIAVGHEGVAHISGKTPGELFRKAADIIKEHRKKIKGKIRVVEKKGPPLPPQLAMPAGRNPRKTHATYQKWTDAQDMAKKHPDTFEAPDIKKLRKSLQVGDLVKWSTGKDRMWLAVADIKGDTITGVLMNESVDGKMKYGDIVKIKFRHVYEVASAGDYDNSAKREVEKYLKEKSGKKKTKKKRKKKTEAEKLIEKSRKLWDVYVAKPTKKGLRDMFSHLRKMEKSTTKTVKREWRVAKAAAKKEAKRLKMKVK